MDERIMRENRHMFMYGYDGDKRQKLLMSLEKDYPINIDKDIPMAIYIQNGGFPSKCINNELDKTKLEILARDYLYYIVSYKILLNIKNQVGFEQLNNRVDRLLKMVSYGSLKPIKDLNELIKLLQETYELYIDYYKEYVLKGETHIDIFNAPIQFLQIEQFVKNIKKSLNNNSYFGIILDQQNLIAEKSQQAINGLIGSRINGDLAIKVGCEYEKWKTYYDLNGNHIDYIHDYGTIELDDNYHDHMKIIVK